MPTSMKMVDLERKELLNKPFSSSFYILRKRLQSWEMMKLKLKALSNVSLEVRVHIILSRRFPHMGKVMMLWHDVRTYFDLEQPFMGWSRCVYW